LWYFLRFAVTDTEGSIPITNDDECGEGESTTTLYDLRYAIDEDDALDIRALLSAILTRTTFTTVWLR
jgi:hypothetical protein